MKEIGSILKAIGGFSLAMTVITLWREGFPRLEGPEGDSIQNVLIILAPYAIIGLVSWAIYALGDTLGKKGTPVRRSSTNIGALDTGISKTSVIEDKGVNPGSKPGQIELFGIVEQTLKGSYCPNCGFQAQPNDLFCMKCGEKLAQP